MTESKNTTLLKEGKLTKKSDKEGIEVRICVPGWFDEKRLFKIANAPARTASLEFSGADLNFAARILYAEATGSGAGCNKEELFKEKLAIIHVMYIRLNRKGYPTNQYIATTFEMVGNAPKLQFESVARQKKKFVDSASPNCRSFNNMECADLQLCIDTLLSFVNNGPNFNEFPYDSFIPDCPLEIIIPHSCPNRCSPGSIAA